MALLSCFLPIRIEETWRLWQKFLDDYSRFEDWLKSAERIAAYPNSSEVLYTNAKEELKRFEVKTLSSPVLLVVKPVAGSREARMASSKWLASPTSAQGPAQNLPSAAKAALHDITDLCQLARSELESLSL